MSYELSKNKFHRDLAELFFDLTLTILDLNIIAALKLAYGLLSTKDFYPWKQLCKQITHLIQSSISYHHFIIDSYFSKLDDLERILELIRERTKTNTTILQATHESVLKVMVKWASIINNDT